MFQYSSTFHDYTAVTAAPTENVDFPKSRLRNKEYPLRQMRSTAVAQQDVVADFGSALASATYYVSAHHTNFTTLHLATGTSSDPTHGSYTDNTVHTLTREMNTGRYKGLFAKTMATQYARFRFPNQTPTDGASYLASGLIAVNSNLITLARSPQVKMPIDRNRNMIGERIHRSPPWLEMTWVWNELSGSDLTEVKTLLLLGRATLFLVSLKIGASQEVFLGHFIEEPSMPAGAQNRQDISIRFREWIGPVFKG